MLKLCPVLFTKTLDYYFLKKQQILVLVKNQKVISLDLKTRFIKTSFGIKPSFSVGDSNTRLFTVYFVILNQVWLGLFSGYRRQLNLIGIGYTVKIQDNILILKLGYSHKIFMCVPKDIIALCPRPRKLILKSFSLYNLNTFASVLQSLKSPNSYKRLGIYVKNQKIIIKPGKKI